MWWRDEPLRLKVLSQDRTPPSIKGRMAVLPDNCDMVAMADVEGHHCRFVVDIRDHEGRALMCGAPRVARSSYCAHHHALCERPQPVRVVRLDLGDFS